MMQVGRIILFSIIGLLLGIGYSILTTSGYFERWEKLSSPPPDISEYFFATEQEDSFPVEITNPCNYSKYEFSILSNSPKNIVDCVQIKTNYPDGYTWTTLVRDKNGIIWEWAYISSFGLNELICFPSYGLIIGLVMAIAAKELTKIQKELEQKQKELEQKRKATLE